MDDKTRISRIEALSAQIDAIALDLTPVSAAQLAARRERLLDIRKELEQLQRDLKR